MTKLFHELTLEDHLEDMRQDILMVKGVKRCVISKLKGKRGFEKMKEHIKKNPAYY